MTIIFSTNRYISKLFKTWRKCLSHWKTIFFCEFAKTQRHVYVSFYEAKTIFINFDIFSSETKQIDYFCLCIIVYQYRKKIRKKLSYDLEQSTLIECEHTIHYFVFQIQFKFFSKTLCFSRGEIKIVKIKISIFSRYEE